MSIDESTAATRLKDMIEGFWPGQVINAAVELRIAEVLADRREQAQVVAAKINAAPDAVFRLLRALAAIGICKQCGDSEFELTQLGHLLRADVPNSMLPRVQLAAGFMRKAFADLATMVRTGATAPSIVAGADGFAAMGQQAEELTSFQEVMAHSSRQMGREILKAYDFRPFRSVMDVGGGFGALLGVLLQAHAQMQGLVFDLPFLETASNAYRAKIGVGSRSRFIAGDFFKGIPALADCYMLKFIIHDWDDERSIAILRSCAAAAGSGGTVLIVEAVVPERVGDAASDREVIRSDLLMMAFGGKERTASEYRSLLTAAGLQMTRVVPSEGACSVIEARVKP